MSLIADILLVAASLGLAVYCVVLSRRLARFTDLEKGVGGAVAVLSAQVDDLTKALKTARETAQGSVSALDATTTRAEDVARRLELHVAALHDLPPQPAPVTTPMPPQHSARIVAEEERLDAGFAETEAARDPSPPLSFSARRPAADTEAEPGNTAPAQSLFAHRKVQPGALG